MIKLITVGKIKEKALSQLVDEYAKRIQPYHKLEMIEVKDQANYKDDQVSLNEEVKNKEAAEILKKINERDTVVLIDLHGVEMDSLKFAKKLDELMANKQKDICFVIAGSLGFGSKIIERANFKICLSKMTFPHQMVKLIVLEQLYRGFKILNNETYHK